MSAIFNHLIGMKRTKKDKCSGKKVPYRIGPKKVKVSKSVDITLKNYVILSEIFQFLPTSDLLSCRQVNKRWKEVVGIILRKRETFQTTWILNPALNTFEIKSKRQDAESADLGEFIEHFSKDFPSKDFRFLHGNLNIRSAQQFFDLHGKTVARLELDIFATVNASCGEYTSISTFQEVILKLPNLTYLSLKNLPAPWLLQEFEFIPDQETKLEKLRVIEVSSRCSSHQAVIRRLVEVAVNLKTFVGFHPAFSKAFESPQKRRAIETFLINPTVEFLDLFEQSGFVPAVKELTLSFEHIDFDHDHYFRAAKCLIQVLRKSEGILKSVRGFYPIELFATMNLPKVHSVEHLFLDSCQIPSMVIGSNPGFIDSLWIEKSFPSLNVVELGFWLLTEHNQDFFGHLEPIQSVRTLKLVGTGNVFNLRSIPKISYMFPNVVNLFVGATSNYINIMKSVWSNFTLLKHFSIECLLIDSHFNRCGASPEDWTYDNSYTPDFDWAITGISVADLKFMRHTSREFKYRALLKSTSSSILNMIHLKKFEVYIKSIPNIPIPHKSLFSYLSAKYGFEKMKTLEFIIYICPGNWRPDLICALDPMSKVAKIVY